MKILFITLLDIRSIDSHNIYSDLIREFAEKGHEVYVVSPAERRNSMKSGILIDTRNDIYKNVKIIKVKTGNIQKTNLIEKGISTLLIEYQIQNAIKKFCRKIKFDLVLYSTPPITLLKPIKYVKKRDNAKSYLMLKDIFPQNALDMGMLSKCGWKGILYRYFREKEKKLYEVSDTIGCMSAANLEYVKNNNPEIAIEKLEICPNCIKVQEKDFSVDIKRKIRKKYDIPVNKKVFIYGGNLGKPQGIPFIIDCLRAESNNKEIFFLIVGDGTEYSKLEEYVRNEKPDNVHLIKRIPKEDYDVLVAACDVGLIFLDYKFTIPNYPSRLLGYMQAGLPIVVATDKNTDIGEFVKKKKIGYSCYSNDVKEFESCIKKCLQHTFEKEHVINVLKENYSTEQVYVSIIERVDSCN